MPAVRCQTDHCSDRWTVRVRTEQGQRRLCAVCADSVERTDGRTGEGQRERRAVQATARALGDAAATIDVDAWNAVAWRAAALTVTVSDLATWQRAARRWGRLGDADGTDVARNQAEDGYIRAVMTAAARTGIADAARAVASVTMDNAARARMVHAAAWSGTGRPADGNRRLRCAPMDPMVLADMMEDPDRVDGWDPDSV